MMVPYTRESALAVGAIVGGLGAVALHFAPMIGTLIGGGVPGPTGVAGATGPSGPSGPSGPAAWERDFTAYNAANLSGGTSFAVTRFTAAATLTGNSNLTYDIAGVGVGNFVAMLCDDGTTCALGHVHLTCTKPCGDPAGSTTQCTVNLAAVAAVSTLTWSVTTACGTSDPGVNATANATIP